MVNNTFMVLTILHLIPLLKRFSKHLQSMKIAYPEYQIFLLEDVYNIK